MKYTVEALLLADNIYQDVSSRKFILSGLFHQINVPTLPFMLTSSFGIFVSISGFEGEIQLKLTIIDKKSKTPKTATSSFEMKSVDKNIPVSFGLEVPPFEIQNVGLYGIDLEINEELVHSAPLLINKIEMIHE
ncbi:hypothetical protein KORDIASMS9_03357 [Kordia sp. SMS9]|uniref:DUF6941 family protein n=1 Tax=Kordia sp. SMS9 TaxID=2282170 RepID=UPI000E0D6CDE|nr:hypothetical protein [Kordia sp. SMS9]AXG71102.1 hypothetical protein KORDIASMS9_03357 [Kordia sp. SMS9]